MTFSANTLFLRARCENHGVGDLATAPISRERKATQTYG
jgi:hypothetical protein